MFSVSVIGCKNCSFKSQRSAPAECPLKTCAGKLISIGIENEEDVNLLAMNVGEYIKKKYTSIEVINCNCVSGFAEIDTAKILLLDHKNEVSHASHKFAWNQNTVDCGTALPC